MPNALPPLTWFRSFEAAARTLSFTAAGEEIGLTQSAVSQQVKSLELRLGVPLFVRKPRGLMLTDEGRKLLPQVGAALDGLSAATQTLQTAASDALLTVATSVSVAQWVIAPRLPDFVAQRPNARLRLLSAIWPDDFNASQADVEIRFGSAKQVGQNAEALGPNKLIAVKAVGLRGGLTDLPLIEAVGTSSGWHKWQEQLGGVYKPAIYVDTYGMALQLAAQGNGIALVSALLAAHALDAGQVEMAHPASIPSQEGYFIAARGGSDLAGPFRDWVLRQWPRGMA